MSKIKVGQTWEYKWDGQTNSLNYKTFIVLQKGSLDHWKLEWEEGTWNDGLDLFTTESKYWILKYCRLIENPKENNTIKKHNLLELIL